MFIGVCGGGDVRLMHGFRCGFTCAVCSLGKVLMWFTELLPKRNYGH